MSWKYLDIPVKDAFDGKRKYLPLKWLGEFKVKNEWVLAIRVLSKSGITRTSSLSSFNIIVRDAGTIKQPDQTMPCTVLGDIEFVDTFYELLEVGKAYFLSQVESKLRLMDIPIVEEVIINNQSLVQECFEPGDQIPLPRPMHLYKFIQFAAAVEEPNEARFDIIGVCTAVGVLDTTSPLRMRKITLVDESDCSIDILINNSMTDIEDNQNWIGLVVAVINCMKRGKHITTTDKSRLQKDPIIDKTQHLKTWFNSRQTVDFKKVQILSETKFYMRAIDHN